MSNASVSGLSNVKKMLHSVNAKVTGNTKAEQLRVATAIAKKARELVPVDTGDLRNSIHVQNDKLGSIVIAGTDHAAAVEYGTIKQEAQPYMRPAAASVKPSEQNVKRGV